MPFVKCKLLMILENSNSYKMIVIIQVIIMIKMSRKIHSWVNIKNRNNNRIVMK